MSARVEHTDAYWRGFGRKLIWLALDKERARTLNERSDAFRNGDRSAHRVWATEERHAWGGSQDAVTRRVGELAARDLPAGMRRLDVTDDEYRLIMSALDHTANDGEIRTQYSDGSKRDQGGLYAAVYRRLWSGDRPASTDAEVLKYIAESAESMIEDDMNEAGYWTDEEFEALREAAFEWIGAHR